MTAAVASRLAGLHVESVGAGPPLLVAHGGPGANHTIYRTLDPLAVARRVVYWDHRGHGRSDPLPDAPTEMSAFADDVVRVADGLGLERFALFGHSFGGWVAQEAALRHPDRIAALVLAGTTPGQLGATESAADDQGPPPPQEITEIMAGRPESDADVVEMYHRLGPHFSRSASAAVLEEALNASPVSADALNRVFDALARWSSVDRLHEVACPTLLVAGRFDDFCSVAQHERIARRLADPDLVVVDGVGHFTWLERPSVLELIDTWLREHGW